MEKHKSRRSSVRSKIILNGWALNYNFQGQFYGAWIYVKVVHSQIGSWKAWGLFWLCLILRATQWGLQERPMGEEIQSYTATAPPPPGTDCQAKQQNKESPHWPHQMTKTLSNRCSRCVNFSIKTILHCILSQPDCAHKSSIQWTFKAKRSILWGYAGTVGNM